MKIAIISDIHDNVWNLRLALERSELQEADALLCCGDLCAPFIIKLLGQGYGKAIHLVLGNNDGDLASIIRVAENFPHLHIHGEYFQGEFGGKTFAMNHYPEKAGLLAESGAYDVVCYGHNHSLERDKKIGKTLMLNPGAIMGYHGGKLEEIDPTFLVLDTDKMEADVVRLIAPA